MTQECYSCQLLFPHLAAHKVDLKALSSKELNDYKRVRLCRRQVFLSFRCRQVFYSIISVDKLFVKDNLLFIHLFDFADFLSLILLCLLFGGFNVVLLFYFLMVTCQFVYVFLYLYLHACLYFCIIYNLFTLIIHVSIASCIV